MKNTFQEYHTLDEEEIKKIWSNAIFIFDTNVLLNLYRYSQNTSDEFIRTITELKDRIWLPFQVGLEFYKNRLTVISSQEKNYTNFGNKFHTLVEEIENRNRNPFFSSAFTDRFTTLKNDLDIEIKQKKDFYDNTIKADPILKKINFAFDNKIGKCFNSEDELKLQKEGEKRYKYKIPPGFCDIKKPETERYGDLLIWKQIIQKSNESKIDIILVLDDRKEDWWYEHQGKTISARPELLKEFRTETGKNIHFYKPFQFLEYSNENLKSTIDRAVIEEVKHYEPTIIKIENFIKIDLALKGELKDFNSFTNEIKNTGYEIFTESNEESNIHFLSITLPNIPDLKRRFDSKFITKLSNYDLSLVDRKYL